MKQYKYTGTISYHGKRYYIRADSKEELAAKKALKLRDLQDGKIVVSANTSVRDWMESCISTYKTNIKDSTMIRFRYLVEKHILSQIGDQRISQIKPIDCQRILNAQQGKSQTQVNEVLHGLRFIFQNAKRNGLIATDPSEYLVKPITAKKKHRRALTAYERMMFLEVGFKKRKYYYFMLMLLCGCRPSEASSAMGYDIQSRDGINVLHIRGTKTETAFIDRFVPIPDILYHHIKNTPENENIALYQNGNPIKDSNRRRPWESIKRDLNIAMGCSTYRNKLIPPYPLANDLVPYCLRHEYCTELARQGIDIRIAQKLMGHASIKMTVNVYTNLDFSDTASVAHLLGATSGATSG